VVDDGAEFGES